MIISNKKLDKIPTRELTTKPTTETEPATELTKAKSKCEISSLKLCEKFLNEIKNENIYIYIIEQIFK